MRYTKEQIEFIKNNVKGISLRELTNRFNTEFNQNRSESAIENIKRKYKLLSGIKGGQFQKGDIPFNKGKKQTEFMSEMAIENTKLTRFKKGQTPVNHKPVGSERICSKDGYILIKVAEPNKWEHKHRVVWEKAYGKIPEGNKILFLDQNKLNLDLDNLKIVTAEELVIMNKNKLISNDKEITETGTLIAKTKARINEIKRS